MNAITTTAPKAANVTALMDPAQFDQMWRVGKMLAMSPLFPEHLRKGPDGTAVANGVLVMNMALRLNEDPLTVAQNIYFVSGKPGWSSSYMISKANQFGVFKDPIDWEVTGEGNDLSVTAFAEMAGTGRRVSAKCDMALARGEGWTKNKKYQTMPEQMLRYRSATFLIRLYCPEVMVGVPAMVEVEDGGEMRDITPIARAEAATPKPAAAEKPAPKAEKPAPKQEAKAPKQDTAPEQTQEPEPEASAQPQDQGDNAPDPAQFQGLYDMIRNDLMACGGDYDGVISLYGAQIEQLEQSAPDLHTNLMAEVEKFKAE